MSESYHAFQLSFSPSTSELEAYLAGVLKGDGSCTDYIRLGVADLDFAQAFADAIKQVFHVSVTPRKDKRGYWHAKTCNYTGKFSYLLTFEPTTLNEKAQWLRGMFDSEGNAQIHKLSRGENCYGRRVAMYSTMLQTLERACEYLSSLGIKSCIRTTKNSPGHKGTKTVYELSLLSGKVNFDRFRVLVGTSLARKQERLDAIVASYVPDLSASMKQAQLKGAARKREKMMQETLPSVLIEIQMLQKCGTKPTFRKCYSIPGYLGLIRHFSHAELVRMAKGEQQC